MILQGVFWALAVTGLFAGTGFKFFQSWLWICASVLAMYFVLMSPDLTAKAAAMLPPSWKGDEMILALAVAAPLLCFLFAILTLTFCESEFSIYRLPRGLNTIGAAVNGAIFGMLITDTAILLLMMTDGRAGIPETEARELARMSVNRVGCVFSVVNYATFQPGRGAE